MLPSAYAADLRVDHATIAGKNLAQMREEFAKAGFPSEYGGEHPNHATQMAVISFADGSYLELASAQEHPDPKSLDAHPWAKFIRSDSGPCAWAVRTSDIAADVKRLRAAGVPIDNPVPGGRERPDGVRLRWETAQVHADRGAFFPFMIQDGTPREQRVFGSGRPTAPSYSGISKVMIAVGDLEEAITHYRATFALKAPHMSSDDRLGAKLASFDGTPVVLAAPLVAGSGWIDGRLRSTGEAPCAFVVRRAAGRASPEIEWLKFNTVGGWIGVE